MRYLGSKDSLIDEIASVINDNGLKTEGLSFFDAFCGTGSVANAFKDTFKIILNDSLQCSVTYAKGRIVSSLCTFDKLGFDPFIYLNENKVIEKGFIYNTYSPGGSNRMYFSEENAGRIDFFRHQIQRWQDDGLLSENEYSYLLACLLEAVSKVSNTAGVYGAFLKHWDSRSHLEIKVEPIGEGGLFDPSVTVYNQRIEDIISDVDCDILYLDPPYTQNQYGTQYHLLETIILDDNPPVSKVTGSRPISSLRSDWSKDIYAHILFERIVATTKAKYILFSYNNDGFMSKDFIESTMKRFGEDGTYECREISYKKYNNTKCHGREGHLEYLFFIKKKGGETQTIESPLNYSGSKAKMVPFIKSQLPADIVTFVDVFGGGFNVGVNINAPQVIYNDINPFVVGLIESFRDVDTCSYLRYIYKLIKDYNLEPSNVDGYNRLRAKYNSIVISKRDPKMLYTLILFGFQQQIRFNSDKDFNIPCGQRRFNERLISKFISFARVMRTKPVEIRNVDYRELLQDYNPQAFYYLDPPYRETTATYNDGKRGFEGWTLDHENEMCELLDSISFHGGRFMLSYVIDVDGFHNYNIEEWASRHNYNVIPVDGAQGRYCRRREVIITNY